MLDQSQAAGGSEMVDVDGLKVADGSLGGDQGKKAARWIGLRTWVRPVLVQVRESFA
jgi:hypothetical protein